MRKPVDYVPLIFTIILILSGPAWCAATEILRWR
jgi:hypothetical protein